MFHKIWSFLSDMVNNYINDEILTRGAAISYYTVTSLAPILFIVVAIAGLVFGQDAAQGAIVQQLSGLIGQQTSEILQTAIKNSSDKTTGVAATFVGIITLIVTASGVFVELQTTLNVIWKVEPQGTTLSRWVRARAASLGLIATFGFLLLVSLIVSAALSAVSGYINSYLPNGHFILRAINFIVSFCMISALIASIYKVLPDKHLQWRHVAFGAIVTAFLFTFGKYLIGLYIGSSAITSTYGAAGAIIVLLIWIYYSSQIFLIGAEFTKTYTDYFHGSVKTQKIEERLES